jgi:hypothetical protein
MQALAVVPQGDGLGTVTSSPAGIACGQTCNASFVSDSQVTLTAAANTDSTFTGWTGCDSVSGATCTVAMTGARSVTATFMLQRFALSVARSGGGNGTVTSNPSGINCGTAARAPVVGTAITLTAAPTVADRHRVTGCDSTSGATCTLTMGSPRSVTATSRSDLYAHRRHTGAGSGRDVECPASAAARRVPAARHSTSVTLTASPTAN